MPVCVVAGILFPARLARISGRCKWQLIIEWRRGDSPRLFLRMSRLGLLLDTGYVQSGENASPYVLEPGDSSETFQSLPLTLRDR